MRSLSSIVLQALRPRIISLQQENMDVLTLVLLLAWFWFSALDVRVGVFAAPQCTIASPLSQNSLGQSPCVVIVDLWAYCTGLDETWQPLLPTESYAGPDAALGEVNPCSCSSVAYSMMSACGYCQGAAWTSWALYIAQCAGAQNTGFPSPIPAGINIPHWAYIGPTTWSDGFWDPVAATSIGDSPESSAGGGTSATTAAASTQSNTPSTRLPSSSTTITFVSGSATATNSASSPPKSPPAASTSASSKASNVGPIVGGVVAGVVVIAGAAVAVMWLCMRRRPQDEHQGA
ncbi:hypothetical protein JAAARDRAFT_74442 [Jaapia argillacea MUCL 33604]|uniref:Uncharacterized protein n=1 Tax=Jaapia argillacea MUCL 33604 TaxID=933084 RepID=A0A067P5E6_9AGAM|nr:hypothetical protein JAAARDRAFT_74442 [Jaapia argillacea MUCL 33604]